MSPCLIFGTVTPKGTIQQENQCLFFCFLFFLQMQSVSQDVFASLILHWCYDANVANKQLQSLPHYLR